VCIVRESRKFSWHPYMGRIARSSLRQHSFLVLVEAIQAENMSMHKVLKLSRLHTVYTFEYASTTHNEYFLFTV